MRRQLLLMLLAFFTVSFAYSQKGTEIKLKAKTNNFSVESQSRSGMTINASFSSLNLKKKKEKNQGIFVNLEAPGLIKIFGEGMPNIPVFSKLIEIPQGASVKFNVVSYDEEIINLSDYDISEKLYPAQVSQSKSEDNPPFKINEDVYNTNAFVAKDIIKFEEAGMLRAARIGNITINPIEYNPVTNTLKIKNNLVIEITFENSDFIATDALKQKYASPYFDNVLKGSVINFDGTQSRVLLGQNTIHLVIIADRMFETQLAPYIAWKVKKGFKVTVGYTDDAAVGTTTNSIKSYLQGIYNGSNPMDFVLLVGDVQQIPAWSGTSGSHVTDLYYFDYTNDNISDVYYGRFSAQNTDQLQPQIDKTLMYEKYEMPDPTYLGKQVLVAGVDASNAPVFGNGAINYMSENYANADNGVTDPLTYLYNDAANSTVMTSNDAGASASITSYMSQGVGWANYTAHCSPAGWADPSFELTELASITNDGKYGLWIGNCCLSVKFDDNECFGEAALRKANAGAIGDIGGSNSTYWDEDYWWATGVGTCVEHPLYEDFGLGGYDAVYHTKANEVNDPSKWYVTQGQLNTVGKLAVEASSSTKKLYYWEIYHLMGDPSLMNYIGVPSAMTVTSTPSAIMIGMTTLDVASAPYSYVALSQNGVLVATALSDASGNANLTFANDALTVGDADLVVTAQNKQPYIGTITISPANAPYVTLESYTTSVSPDFGATLDFNVILQNVAASGSGYDAANVQATISSTDAYVTINDNNASFGTINAAANSTQNAAYNITIANNVPDQHVITFDLAITADGGNSWNSSFNLTVNAPLMTFGDVTIDDSASGNNDGILDPNETANIIILTKNEGHADVTNTISNMAIAGSNLVINTATTSPYNLAQGSTANAVFNVTANNVSEGTDETLNFSLTAGTTNQFTANKSQDIVIGFVPNYGEPTVTTKDEYIIKVQFNDIDNASGWTGGYEDYSNISTIVEKGQSYPITVTVESGYDSDAVTAWVDWNYDGVFDNGSGSNEKFILDWADPIASGNILVPADAISRNLRMRIRLVYSEIPQPTGNSSYGETEDYTISFDTGSGIRNIRNDKISIYPNPTTGILNINLVDNKEADISILDITGKTIYQTSTNEETTSIDLSNNPHGIYFVKVVIEENVYNTKIVIE